MPKEDWQINTVERIFAPHYPRKYVYSILDVGCGLSMKSQYARATVRVGVDIHRPYLEQARKQSSFGSGFVLIEASALLIEDLFLPKSFDVVICIDVVEHLYKEAAIGLMLSCERIARLAVCIETPLGNVPQNLDITGFGAHKEQTHRSAWKTEDFTTRGYHVATRPYTMENVKRHSEQAVDPHITLIDAIKRMDT